MNGLAMALLALASTLLVGLYRRLAISRHWFDVPNHRSSHEVVTPRGAGIVFALLSVMAAWLVLPALWVGAAAGLAVAAVGWLDDLMGLPARYRFVAYAAAIGVFLLSGLPGGLASESGLVCALIGVLTGLLLLWLLNLFNFMDGINGIAGVEAAFVLLGALLLAPGAAEGYRQLLGCTVAAVTGFLVWNFPRGRVFMGDAGSVFLGFWIGCLAAWSVVAADLKVWTWLLLLAVFVVDASYTLAVRLLTGQRWHQPHRSHAYQHLARRWGAHGRVVALLLAIDLFWLLPLAWLAQAERLPGAVALVIGCLPLLLGCYTLRAGQESVVADGSLR